MIWREATCHFLRSELFVGLNLQVTRIGFSLPSGAGITYVDQTTFKSVWIRGNQLNKARLPADTLFEFKIQSIARVDSCSTFIRGIGCVEKEPILSFYQYIDCSLFCLQSKAI